MKTLYAYLFIWISMCTVSKFLVYFFFPFNVYDANVYVNEFSLTSVSTVKKASLKNIIWSVLRRHFKRVLEFNRL